jgi:hypothetical protein
MKFAVSTGYPRRRALLLMDQWDRAPRIYRLLAGPVLRERAGEFARLA